MLREQQQFFRSVLIACDLLVLAAAAVGAYFLRFHVFPEADESATFRTHAIPIPTYLAMMILAFVWARLWVARRHERFYSEAWAITKGVVIGVGLTIAFVTFFQKTLYTLVDYSRLQYVLCAGLSWIGLLTWRYAFRLALRLLRKRGWNLRHVAIIGAGRLGQVVCRTLRRNSWTGIHPGYFISHHPTTRRSECLDVPIKGGLDDLERILDETLPSAVFVALPGRHTHLIPQILARLDRYPVDIRLVPDVNPRYMPTNMVATEIDGMPVLSVRTPPLAGWARVNKRVLDLAGGVAALLVFGIPMLVIAALVRASGPGPVIFRQERMSLNGQRFKIFKFRTMDHVDAEAQALRDAGKGADAWTKKDDPRITKIGKFLRKTSLDELPQLFNVILGEMSLVGPRPERPELIERFRDDWRGYMLRQNVKAGMTGWAQVNGLRGATSLKKRLQYDLFYIRNWSIRFDLRILWMTIFKGFAHENAH